MNKFQQITSEIHCAKVIQHIIITGTLIGGNVIVMDLALELIEGKIHNIKNTQIYKIITSENEYSDDEVFAYLEGAGLSESEIMDELVNQFIKDKGYDKPENQTEYFQHLNNIMKKMEGFEDFINELTNSLFK